jgi:hypothetical protein
MGEFDYAVVNWAGRLEDAAAAIAGIIDAEKHKVAVTPPSRGGGGAKGA